MNEEIKRQIYQEWLEGSPKRDLCWRYQIEPRALERVLEQMKLLHPVGEKHGNSTAKK